MCSLCGIEVENEGDCSGQGTLCIVNRCLKSAFGQFRLRNNLVFLGFCENALWQQLKVAARGIGSVCGKCANNYARNKAGSGCCEIGVIVLADPVIALWGLIQTITGIVVNVVLAG